MARGKKKESHTLEEKLEAALVPEEEQPYKVPGNWCWIKLLNSFENLTNSKKKIQTKLYQEDGKIPIIDQGQEFIGGYTDDESMKHDAKLPVIVFGDHTRCLKYIDFSFAQGADGVKVLKPYPFFSTKAFYYAFQSIDIPNMGYRRHYPLFKDFSIPLPPLAEQHRIVERIESLFSQLDEARDKAQEALDGFEERKASILHKAFIGELTEQWRQTTGFEKKYELKKISDVCVSLKYGTSKKSEPDGEIAVIRMGNLQEGEIDWTNLVYSNDADDNRKYLLSPGDVLFNRTNSSELVGKTSIYRGEFPAIYAGYIIKLDYDHEIVDGEFLNYILNSSEAREYCNKVKTDGVNQSNINAKKIGDFSFFLPLIKEQREIVKIIKRMLEGDKQAREIANRTIEDINSIKKSILAKAFRGELGTNDPEDENAVELLKAILKER